jgi:hypothetical protein
MMKLVILKMCCMQQTQKGHEKCPGSNKETATTVVYLTQHGLANCHSHCYILQNFVAM